MKILEETEKEPSLYWSNVDILNELNHKNSLKEKFLKEITSLRIINTSLSTSPIFVVHTRRCRDFKIDCNRVQKKLLIAQNSYN